MEQIHVENQHKDYPQSNYPKQAPINQGQKKKSRFLPIIIAFIVGILLSGIFRTSVFGRGYRSYNYNNGYQYENGGGYRHGGRNFRGHHRRGCRF